MHQQMQQPLRVAYHHQMERRGWRPGTMQEKVFELIMRNSPYDLQFVHYDEMENLVKDCCAERVSAVLSFVS